MVLLVPDEPVVGGQQTQLTAIETLSVRPCDHHIKETLALTRKMIHLADKGDADREDVGCGILYGILRDSAFKIMKLAEKEKQAHQSKGWWKESGD